MKNYTYEEPSTDEYAKLFMSQRLFEIVKHRTVNGLNRVDQIKHLDEFQDIEEQLLEILRPEPPEEASDPTLAWKRYARSKAADALLEQVDDTLKLVGVTPTWPPEWYDKPRGGLS